MLSSFGPDILRLLYLKTKITGAEPFPGSLQDGKGRGGGGEHSQSDKRSGVCPNLSDPRFGSFQV